MTACYSVGFRLAPLPHGTPPTTHRHCALSTRSESPIPSPAACVPPVRRDLAELPRRSPPPPEAQWSLPREQTAPHPSPRSSKARTPRTNRSTTGHGTAARPSVSSRSHPPPSPQRQQCRHYVLSATARQHPPSSLPTREADGTRRTVDMAPHHVAPARAAGA